MAKYIKNYCNYWGYGEQDYIPCEHPACVSHVTDVHHIKYKSHGGRDEHENLIGLCRQHHDKAHVLGSDSETVWGWQRRLESEETDE